MANEMLDKAVGALTSTKGATLAAVAVLSVATLLSIGTGADPASAPPRVDAAPAAPAAEGPATPAASAAPTQPTASGQFSAAQTKAIQRIVHDYLVKNPEVLMEVGKALEAAQQQVQAAEAKKVIIAQKTKIFRSQADFVLGNQKGDVTVVEFFDYNCGWCKRALDEVVKLTKAEPNIRVVMKEFPIFGGDSVLAAKAAIASIRQGKYWDFHTALMREKQVTKDNVFQIAQRVGLNVEKLKADMNDPKIDATLKETHDVAQALGVEGTPGFIVDSRLNVGFLPADGLRTLIGEVRKSGCEAC